jgi:hypothetical protein
MFFTRKYIKIIFFIFLKLFLTSTHQNDLKTPKNMNLKQKKIKKNYFFKNTFKMKK